MREQLLAYLLGQLEPAERHAVERILAQNPDLRQELEKMRACLADAGILEGSPPADPAPTPSGLAERTCRHVAVSAWAAGSLAAPGPGTSWHWRWADMLVALGVALATAAFLIPALQQSRHLARRHFCENNLARLGHGIHEFAQIQHGLIPVVPAQGKDAVGGIYSVRLADAHVIDRQTLIQHIICPSSQLAVDLQNHAIRIHIPTHSEFLAAEGRRLDWFRHMIGGSYAYRIGYMEGNRYHTIRIRQTGRVPLMADAPSRHLANFQSANHAGSGQNVLFDDGHVRFLTESSAPDVRDPLYTNRQGIQAAGCDAADTVLAASSVSPAIHLLLDRK